MAQAWSGVCFYTVGHRGSFRLADFPAVRDGDFDMQGRFVRISITAAMFSLMAFAAPAFRRGRNGKDSGSGPSSCFDTDAGDDARRCSEGG